MLRADGLLTRLDSAVATAEQRHELRHIRRLGKGKIEAGLGCAPDVLMAFAPAIAVRAASPRRTADDAGAGCAVVQSDYVDVRESGIREVDSIFIDGDEVRKSQVLSNLLENATKYTDAGAIEVTQCSCGRETSRRKGPKSSL